MAGGRGGRGGGGRGGRGGGGRGGRGGGGRRAHQREQLVERPAANADLAFPEDKFRRIHFYASDDDKTLSEAYNAMVTSMLTAVSDQSQAENNGNAITQVRAGFSSAVLPKDGRVILVLHPAASWENARGPLRFLIRLKDLYLEAFLPSSASKWKVFKDVRLKNIIPGIDINKHATNLKYTSSYIKGGMDINWDKVELSKGAVSAVYRMLTDEDEPRRYSQGQIQEALATIIVLACEATRRRSVHKRLRWVFLKGIIETVDRPIAGSPAYVPGTQGPEERRVLPSYKFRSWSTDCDEMWDGPDIPADATFEQRVELMSQHHHTLEDLAVILPRSSDPSLQRR